MSLNTPEPKPGVQQKWKQCLLLSTQPGCGCPRPAWPPCLNTDRVAAMGICGQGRGGHEAGTGPAAFHGQGRMEELGVQMGGPFRPEWQGWSLSFVAPVCSQHTSPHGRICCWTEELVTRGISLDQSLQTGKWGLIPTPFRFTKTLRSDPGEVQAEGEEAPMSGPLSRWKNLLEKVWHRRGCWICG